MSWELLAQSGLQMLCPPEDSQLLSILVGVTQITVLFRQDPCLPPSQRLNFILALRDEAMNDIILVMGGACLIL